jgi:hypothetical protein
MADARFTINDDDSDQGYDAEALEELSLRLKTLPPAGVSTVRFQVWNAAAFDPDDDAIVNPPRKSKGAPDLVLEGTTSGPSVSPASVGDEVTVTLPADERVAWIVRCVVNGGQSLLPDGRSVFDRTLVHERMIVVRAPNGSRPIIATETTQYENDGWAAEFAVIEGPPGPTGAAGADGADGAQGEPGEPGFGSVDATLELVGDELRRAAIAGVVTIPSGSNVSDLRAIPASEDASGAVSGGVPFVIRRRLTMAGGAGSTTGIVSADPAFPSSMPWNARLIDAWIHVTTAQAGSSLQVFKNSTAGGNELTSVLASTSAVVVRNADSASRTVAAGDTIIVRKNGAAFLGVVFEVNLMFLRLE